MAKSTARGQDKATAWRRTIRQQASSGMSVRAWCRQHEIHESGFYWWRRELARRDVRRQPSVRRNPEKHATSFVPVHVADVPGPNHDPQIEIVLTDGRCIRIHAAVDRQMLADVLDVLTSTSSVAMERRAC